MNDTPDLPSFLAQLEAERERLDLMIGEIRRRLGLSAPNGDSMSPAPGVAPATFGARDSAPGRIRSDEFFRMSMSEAIRRYLEIMRQPQMPKAIADSLKAGGILSNAKHFNANVFTELQRMRDRGLVVNTPSGWGLAEWYPQKPKQAEAKAKRKQPKKASAKRGTAKRQTPPKATSSAKKPRRTGAWHAFAAERIKAGKSMREAAAEWKEVKARQGA